MKKYVFITGRYLPKPEATGLCVHKIASFLAQNNRCVRTVAIGNKNEELNIDGVSVSKIKAPFFMREGEMSSFCVFASRLHKLVHFFDYPLRSGRLRKRYVKEVLKHINKDDEVGIIASFSPFEAVSSMDIIRRKAKCKSLKLYYYSADTLSNEQGDSAILSADFRESIGRRQERNIFKICEKIFIMDCHKSHYFSDYYKDFRDKIAVVDFPLLDKNLYAPKVRDNNGIKIVFAGTLYKSLRNPSFVCDTFLRLQNFDYKLIFIGGGDCEDIVQKKCFDSNGKIEYLGKQPYETAKAAIQDADVLLSIGNAKSPMMPSKIYEYISTGKPIIHFSSWEEDPCIPVLKKYGNALIVSLSYNLDDILRFLNELVVVSWETIEENFNKSNPSFTAKYLR